MKKVIILVALICTFYTSCTTSRLSTKISAKQLENVWKNQMQSIDSKRIDTLIKEDNLNPLLICSSCKGKDSVFYYSKDNEQILAMVLLPGNSNDWNPSFEQRYTQLSGLFNDPEIGNKLVAKGSYQNGPNWIFVIEYIRSNVTDNHLYFSINAYINGKVVVSTITTDQVHLSDAISLVNSFTQSVANVTLTLK